MPAFATTRETYVAAPPATVHALLDDFRQWERWSPWEEMDRGLRRSYSGPEHGVGAHYAWEGNRKVGSGSMTITRSTPEQIDIDLEFLAPFKARNETVFRLLPEGDGTRVRWTMTGRRNVVLALAGRLFLDRAIGQDFDRGLARLKAAAEG